MERFSDLARSAAAIATGQLGWLPEQFWSATAAELLTALEGRVGSPAQGPLSRTELDSLEGKVRADGR